MHHNAAFDEFRRTISKLEAKIKALETENEMLKKNSSSKKTDLAARENLAPKKHRLQCAVGK